MRGVRFHRLYRCPARVVEPLDQIGVAGETFRRRHILDPVLLPQTAGIAKGVDPAFGGNARTGKDDDVFQLGHPELPFALSLSKGRTSLYSTALEEKAGLRQA